jgi:hypothetical protein
MTGAATGTGTDTGAALTLAAMQLSGSDHPRNYGAAMA